MRSVSDCAFRSDRRAVGKRAGRTAPSALLVVLVAALVLLTEPAAGRTPDPSLARRREDRIRREGPLVGALHFAGNETFGADELGPYMKTRESGFLSVRHHDRRVLNADLANLERFYESRGFLEALVVVEDIQLSEDGLEVEIRSGVYEGPRGLGSSVTFAGNAVLPDDERREGELAAGDLAVTFAHQLAYKTATD